MCSCYKTIILSDSRCLASISYPNIGPDPTLPNLTHGLTLSMSIADRIFKGDIHLIFL